MTTTPRIGAPLLVAGQAVPETTVNEQAYLFDVFAAPHFISRALATPPGSPAAGDSYLVAASPTGAWTGQAGNIAIFVNTAWSFLAAKEGFLFWVDDEDALILYNGSAWNTVGLSTGSFIASSALDTDGTLAADSDAKIASQKAVKTYVDAAVTGLLDLKGSTDCSANPNYPAASKGDYYVVTVAGKIGGASGTTVAVGDVYFAVANNAGGTQAAVGASWDVLVHASVAAGGGLLAANNLSDVASPATSRTNLGVPYGAASDLWAGSATAKIIAPDQFWAAAATIALTDAATVTPDGSTGINFKWTMAGSRTLANPTNMKTGQSGLIIITQDATGSRVITYGTNWKFPGGAASGGVLSTAANAVDVISYYVRSDGTILCTLSKAFS